MKYECNFTLKKSTLSNIYYSWRANSKVFNWKKIFGNYQTKDGHNFLRDQATTITYYIKTLKPYWRKHIIWASPFFLKIQETKHLYFE